jgi:hypothetical protein
MNPAMITPMPPMIPIPPRHRRGSALLSVLWMTVILSFVGMALAANVRSEVESTRLLAESEQGYFLARAGIEAALLRMATPAADPRQAEEETYFRHYDFQFATGSARVEFFPAAALYNVNVATPQMLGALFTELGLRPGAADALVQQLYDYRHPNRRNKDEVRDLESLDELLRLPAMTSELYYGGFTAGRRRPPLYEVLGVRATSTNVNVNYAHPELLAVLPGMTESLAEQLVAQRPFREIDPKRMPGLTLSDSQVFSLIAHGRAQISAQQSADVERVVRAVYVRDQQKPLGVRLLEWHDIN